MKKHPGYEHDKACQRLMLAVNGGGEKGRGGGITLLESTAVIDTISPLHLLLLIFLGFI